MHPKKGRSPIREKKEYDEEVIQIDRVTRVVKGGRRLRFRATVVIGNKKGKVGMGVGKSSEVTGAIQKAIAQAKKTLIQVPMAGQTIPHKVQVKFKAARLLLMPACPGTGIIAGGPLRKIVELAGIHDIMAKSMGTNNRVSNTQAGIIALSKLQEIPWLAKKVPAKVQEQTAEKPKDKPKSKPESKKLEPKATAKKSTAPKKAKSTPSKSATDKPAKKPVKQDK